MASTTHNGPKLSGSAVLPVSVRKRRSAPKNRSGCRTCKLRRVRCDEARPKCYTCQRLGLNCDGYQQLQSFNPELIIDPTEKRSFHYFHTQTRPQLASFPEHHFWDQLALQRSYAEESIRRVVVAIGAFHETLETTDQDLRQSRQQIADRLYQQAIAKTMLVLPDMPIADVLLTCILLAFLDNIKGDEWNAYKHVSGASAILEEHRATNKSHGQSLVVNRVLTPIIEHLTMVVHTLYAPSAAFLYEPVTDMPFVSFIDAYDQFCITAEDIVARKDYNDSPSSLECECFGTLDVWWKKVSELLDKSGGHTCHCEWPLSHAHHMLGALFLEMTYLTTRARLHCALTGLETTLDSYEQSYHRVLDICEQLGQIINSSSDIDTTARRCLRFRPVYFTGCWMVVEECRDPLLRRRAVAILRRWQHTDIWDTNLIADSAECLIHREESRGPIQPVTCSSDLPESVRIRFLTATYFEHDARTGMINMVHEAARCRFIKISILRRPEENEEIDASSTNGLIIEALWLDRHINTSPPTGYQFSPYGMPIATGGLFLQAAAPPSANETRLWSMLQETRSGEDLLNERRWKLVHPAIDRLSPRDEVKDKEEERTTPPQKRKKRAKSSLKKRPIEPRKPIWQEPLPSRSTPMEKRGMGRVLRAIVHDVC